MRASVRRTLWGVVFLAGVVMLVAGCGSDDAPPDAVHVIEIDGAIGPITERYVDRAIGKAEDSGAMLIVIEIDTPGGLVSAMRDIVQRMDASNVPIATYVTPSGGRAASAGTFITMAGHFAAMAPSTSIGAASVVTASGDDVDGTLGKKVEEDTAAFARGVAESRGRNVEWADDAVREAVSATSSEAVELNVVDFIAVDRQELLELVENQEVALNARTTVTVGAATEAPIEETGLTQWERFLSIIADPNIAAILLAMGSLGILVELLNPGLFVPGVFGVIALFLGFFGFGVLPVDTVGLILIGFAIVLFALELLVPSGGILGGGGVVSLLLGGIIAFRDTPAEFQPSGLVVIFILFIVGTMFLSLAMGVLRMRKVSVAVGTQAMLGKQAVVRTPLTPDGYVFLQGERWQARVRDGRANPGDTVRIVEADGLRLVVEKEDPT